MENQVNPTRNNNPVWLKTYEELGLTYDINMPPENSSLIDIFEKSFAESVEFCSPLNSLLGCNYAICFKNAAKFSQKLNLKFVDFDSIRSFWAQFRQKVIVHKMLTSC